jgi:hypothetical protein
MHKMHVVSEKLGSRLKGSRLINQEAGSIDKIVRVLVLLVV